MVIFVLITTFLVSAISVGIALAQEDWLWRVVALPALILFIGTLFMLWAAWATRND